MANDRDRQDDTDTVGSTNEEVTGAAEDEFEDLEELEEDDELDADDE